MDECVHKETSHQKTESNITHQKTESNITPIPQIAHIPETAETPDASSNSLETDSEMMADMTDHGEEKEHETASEMEYEWHHYAYIWFWNKYDAMRAQIRFDKRNCFGSAPLPVRFLLMNDMTQKVECWLNIFLYFF